MQSRRKQVERSKGTCCRVKDGRTLFVRDSKGDFELRLARVGAPQTHHPSGRAAKELLESLVLRRPVSYIVSDRDNSSRRTAEVWVGVVHINERMRAAGYTRTAG